MDAIVAVYSDWGIGAGGTQPVVLKADRRHFIDLTRGRTVIAGRKTLADFPNGRPLKNRTNIILTRQDMTIDGALVAHDAGEVLSLGGDNAMVLGGESVFKMLMPYIDRIFVTKIYCCPQSDSYFADLDADENWLIADESELMNEDGIEYRFLRYERKKP